VYLGQDGLVHLVIACRRRVVTAEDIVAADSILASVSSMLEEGALMPVLLQELPALLGTLGVHLHSTDIPQNPDNTFVFIRITLAQDAADSPTEMAAWKTLLETSGR
jgi:hypothetical protein